jgi:hypothetical protein
MTAAAAFAARVLIPGRMNYFYNQSGRRVADALRHLGGTVGVSPLADCPTGSPVDLLVASNLSEVLVGFGDHDAGVARVRDLRGRCRAFVSLAIDCVATPWYRRLCELAAECRADATLDLGLCDQSAHLPSDLRAGYRFAFNGLTPAEQELAVAAAADPTPRPFPWAFVGHVTPDRAALVDRLVTAVDPRGFVYLPELALYPEGESPHLNQGQYEAVLRASRRQVWCSHHPHFYLEPERFRTSLLTGAVPVKVLAPGTAVPADAPFSEWVRTAGDLGPGLTTCDDRLRYLQAWQARPTLAAELARVLADLGLSVGGR